MAAVERVAVEVPTTAEAGTTNAYLVAGESATLVDPGARSTALDEAVARHDPEHVVVTHAHPDHVGAVAAYADGRTVWALRRHAERLERAAGVAPDRTFRAGDRLPGTDLGALATPGHAPDHVAFALPTSGGESDGGGRHDDDESGRHDEDGSERHDDRDGSGRHDDGPGTGRGRDAVLTGDLVVAAGSVAVGADEGDMRAYLTSLRRLHARDPAVLYPGHGPVVEDPRATVERLVRHRLDRERRVEAAVRCGAGTLEAVVDAAYDRDLSGVRDLARSTVVAHLRKLAVEGRVAWDGERATPA